MILRSQLVLDRLWTEKSAMEAEPVTRMPTLQGERCRRHISYEMSEIRFYDYQPRELQVKH